jgi:hypothetical protein
MKKYAIADPFFTFFGKQGGVIAESQESETFVQLT